MKHRHLLAALVVAVLTAFVHTAPAQAQILDRLGAALEDETADQFEKLLREAVRCPFNDMECIEKAEQDGEKVVFTDEDGEVLRNENGEPVTDRSQLPEDKRAGLGEVDANYDFEPGERMLFMEDFADDNVGDFPRRLEFVKGNWEIVERQGSRALRNTGPRHSAVKVPLPETLPERFTIEFDAHFPHGNQNLALATEEPEGRVGHLEDKNYFHFGNNRSGLAVRGDGVESLQQMSDPFAAGLVRVEIMVDGTYAKVFVGGERVANVPNAVLPRSDVLWFENTYFASKDDPIYIENLRVAAGGRDLYDALATEGRVAVQDILFETNSATIQPSSADVLSEIATILEENLDLQLLVEGHTDNEGGFQHNMQLSNDRAAAVKQYLVENHGIAADRLQTIGLGPSQPVASNETEDGRAENRRVELVRIDQGG